MSPWPTSTRSFPIGCAAAPQQGHDPGLASAHVGIPAHQDLIPSELATNLSVLRVFSTGDAQHDGEGVPFDRYALFVTYLVTVLSFSDGLTRAAMR
jgi:hypothetical protein